MIDDRHKDSGDDLWEAARERTREQVRAVFAAGADVPLRTCPHCGVATRTRHEDCPACGRSYFVRPARFSRRTRLGLTALAAVTASGVVAALLIFLLRAGAHDQGVLRARQSAVVAAERHRLAREQKPHHAPSGVSIPPASAPVAARLHARRAMVARLEASITADAAARIRRGELKGGRVIATDCGPLNAGRRRGDEANPRARLGRYACEAVMRRVRGTGGLETSLGIPFVGVVDFARGTLTWCKDNPVGAGDVDQPLAVVRLARECTAARGRAFGAGYLNESPRG